MNAHIANLTTKRKRFAWWCALSPIAWLLITAAMALHVRLGFGYWPSQLVKEFPSLPLGLHDALCVAAMFWTGFSGIHLLVTLIHHRELGFRFWRCVALLLAYVAGCALFIVVEANVPARFATWLLD